MALKSRSRVVVKQRWETYHSHAHHSLPKSNLPLRRYLLSIYCAASDLSLALAKSNWRPITHRPIFSQEVIGTLKVVPSSTMGLPSRPSHICQSPKVKEMEQQGWHLLNAMHTQLLTPPVCQWASSRLDGCTSVRCLQLEQSIPLAHPIYPWESSGS